MVSMATARKSLCLGIGGGSGSGKSWLAGYLKGRLADNAVVFCSDWYYRDNGRLSPGEARKLNFDHPKAIEAPLLRDQLGELIRGRPIRSPRYDYASHARLKETRLVEPAPLVLLEGLLVLHEKALRELMDFSVFIEVSDDVRLIRRIRRDVEQRRVDLEETLRLYEHCVKPMHERFIRPSAAHATWIWRQTEDRKFPQDLLKTLEKALA